MRIVLASQSPRRQALLKELGYDFIVDPSLNDEVFDFTLSIDEALKNVAHQKAKDVQTRHSKDIVIASDTIVYFQGKVLGKPKSEQDAKMMLQALSGNTHQVKTAVCILRNQDRIDFVCTSDVTFHKLTDEQIEHYIHEKKPFDKAGSYGIQECDFVKTYTGEFTNIVGLPQEACKRIFQTEVDPYIK